MIKNKLLLKLLFFFQIIIFLSLILVGCGGDDSEPISIPEELSKSLESCGGFVEYTKGDLPIILTNPHGASGNDPSTRIPSVPTRTGKSFVGTGSNFTTVADENTDIATDIIADEIELITGLRPYIVKARFWRGQIDAGRVAPNLVNVFENPESRINLAYESSRAKPCYDAFHYAIYNSISEIRDNFGRGTILDVHSARNVPDNHLTRGTRNGQSVQELEDIKGIEAVMGHNSLFGLFASQGLLIDPVDPSDEDNPRYLGSFITQRWGSDIAYRWGVSGTNTIDTIQIEISKTITESVDPQVLQNTAELMGAAISQYYYLWYQP
ncbi:MAG: hypothetical protein ACJAUP_002834 [Cellvibrionaceae bacterium]|jgi:hypothetical protein